MCADVMVFDGLSAAAVMRRRGLGAKILVDKRSCLRHGVREVAERLAHEKRRQRRQVVHAVEPRANAAGGGQRRMT